MILKRLRLLTAILTGILVLYAVLPAAALSQTEFDNKFNSTKQHLLTMTPRIGSIGGEWLILGLARAGALTEREKTAYLQAVTDYVQQNGSNRLNARKSTDNARVIIALAALGTDAQEIAGYNLTEPLGDFDYAAKQGINGVIWTLLALDTYQYAVTAEGRQHPATREKLLDEILNRQFADGGWGFSGDVSDPDMTGMALQALAPYRFYSVRIQTAVDKAINRLVSLQREGTYHHFSPESCAQLIVALTALGMDPQTDTRFAPASVSVLDSMLRYAVNGGFSHDMGADYNQMATEQAFYAMTAYRRSQNGQTSLYDMHELCSYAVADANGDGVMTIQDATQLQRRLAEFDVILSAPVQRFCDLNRDGVLSISDVTAIQRLLAA